MLKDDSAALRFSIREGDDERLIIRVHPKSGEGEKRERRRERRTSSLGLLALHDRDTYLLPSLLTYVLTYLLTYLLT